MSRAQMARAMGVAMGALMSPVLFPLFFARGVRFFHSTGVVHSARALPPAGVLAGVPANLAARLAGPVLVRFSGGLFSGEDKADSLGLGIRFHRQPRPSARFHPGDQDLFFVTLRSFSGRKLRSRLAATHLHDYLDNTYWAVAPYEVEGLGRVSLRITPSGAGAPGQDRVERLRNAVETGEAALLLEAALFGTDAYFPLANIRLGRQVSPEIEAAMGLKPGSSGRGLRPYGFLQGVRVVPYAASQFARWLRRALSRRLAWKPGAFPPEVSSLPERFTVESPFPLRQQEVA